MVTDYITTLLIEDIWHIKIKIIIIIQHIQNSFKNM